MAIALYVIAGYVLVQLWWLLLITVMVAGGSWWTARVLDARRRAAMARQLAEFDLAWDATEQDALVRAGNARGIYGHWPPADLT